MTLVVFQLSVAGSYLPPVFSVVKNTLTKAAPHDHLTASPNCRMRRSRLWRVVSVSRSPTIVRRIVPATAIQIAERKIASAPQTIISLSVQTAVCKSRGSGALGVLVAVQLSVPGIYLPPVLTNCEKLEPPQTIISVPVHTAV